MIHETISLDANTDKPSDIIIGTSCIAEALSPDLLDRYSSGFVISQRNVWDHHGDKLLKAMSGLKWEPHVTMVPDGEDTKNLGQFGELLSWLADHKADRKSVLIVLGGGVVGDLSGFVAASYMRGMNWLYVPTTLLAQQDASIGGKVAVNLPQGKNLVGHFWPPRVVVIDTEVLHTLPERQCHAGYMELLKHGMLHSTALYREIVAVPPAYQWETLLPTLVRALKVKVDVVKRDPFETKGVRRLLNLGHTLGHAVESYTKYRYLHGEAVGMGLIFSVVLAEALGECAFNWSDLPPAVFSRLPSDIDPSTWDLEKLLALTELDKKGAGGKIPWIVPFQPGGVEARADISKRVLLEAVHRWAAIFKERV